MSPISSFLLNWYYNITTRMGMVGSSRTTQLLISFVLSTVVGLDHKNWTTDEGNIDHYLFIKTKQQSKADVFFSGNQ